MSRMPSNRTAYGYAHQTHQHHQVIAPNYYYEDTEGYVADYSESDALSEGPHLVPTCATPGASPSQPTQPPPLPPPPQAHTHSHPHAHPPDVTEIYRRKSAAASPPERYQGFYMHPDYYYEVAPAPVHHQQTMVTPPPPQQVRRLTTMMPPPPPPPAPTAGYRRRIPVIDEVSMSPLPPQRYSYYPRQEYGEEAYDAMIYRSSPQITTTSRRVSPLRVPSATLLRAPSRVAIRRHPVTVRTPRYYRRPSAVYKKPSALCLPLSCQPDPAVYRRSKRVVQEQTYKHPQEMLYRTQTQDEPGKTLTRRHSIAVTNDNARSKETSKESIEENNSEFDAMLAKYEKMFRDTKAEGDMKRSDSTSCKGPPNIKNITNLKPKLPPSVKAKQEKIRTKSSKSTRESKEPKQSGKNIERLEVEQITTEVLDNLLSELMNANGENADVNTATTITQKNKTHSTKKQGHNNNQNDTNLENTKKKNHSENSLLKSFNYSDISQSISNTQNFLDSEFNQQNLPTRSESPMVEETQIVPQNLSRCNINNNISPRRCVQRVPLDDSSALELHRSKSYIVNLIDRALSRELGTVPEEKNPIKDCSPYPKNTIESSSKHGACKMDKDMCMDLSHALPDPYTNPSSSGHCDQRPDMVCPCSTNHEPLYVKQLKQLRWGHLKHIQREVRRLEDLERFLDSCASGSYY